MTYYLMPQFSRHARRMIERMRDPDFPFTQPDFAFPVDVKANDDGYQINALIPGVKAEDLNIQVVNETVSIQGEFKPVREEGANYLLAERPEGRFTRTLTLPEPLDAAKAEADVHDGVLTLWVPKAEQARPKSIKVTSK